MTVRADAPGPMMRRGPRPLLLHLTLAMLRSRVSHVNSSAWKPDWPTSSVEAIFHWIEKCAQAENRKSGSQKNDFTPAVFAESFGPDAAFIAGIAAYRRHPWQRSLGDPPTIWSEGSARLLDYGTAGGRAVLFVPSLINRAYVLDLAEGNSMLRWLASQGVRPLLLDWGWPEDHEKRFTLTDYVAGRLERAMTAAAQICGEAPVLAGYCMGGTLAVAAAQRRPDLISGLALLAAPWDFHAPDPERAIQAARTLPLLEPVLSIDQTLPVDVLQALFALLDPWNVAEKYRSFASLPQDSERALRFVALEDWLNDGVPLAANVARTCLGEWYGENAPSRGTWQIAGLPVDPAAIARPTFVAVPEHDRIVPPESACPLGRLIPGATLYLPAAGHIGMAAGARAEAALWRPFRDWLTSLKPSV